MAEKTIPNDKLRQMMMAKLEAQRQASPKQPSRSSKLLGSVLNAYLINHNHLREDLANQLGVEEEFVDALVEGIIPESEISNELLVEIAHAIGYEPNLLRIILNRPLERDAVWYANDETEPETRGMYRCSVEGCKGHDTFSASCLDAKRTTAEIQAAVEQNEGSIVDLQYLLKRIEDQQQATHERFQTVLNTIERGITQLYDKLNTNETIPASALRELDELYEQYQRASYANQLLFPLENLAEPQEPAYPIQLINELVEQIERRR